jgi:peptidoglycan/LPS O-acetylase OafA/YrhL
VEQGEQSGRQARRGDIQGLQAVAVLLVMLDHADIPGLQGGYLGVDVFFVISGFLITGILLREVRRTGRVSIAGFYARRARRILPAASIVLLAIVLGSSQLFGYLRINEVLTDVTWAAFFAANIHSALSGSDYFAITTFLSPVQHFWSLAVEEQFYLVWPPLIALVVFTRRRTRRAGMGSALDPSRTARRLRRLTMVIALLCGLSLAWSV